MHRIYYQRLRSHLHTLAGEPYQVGEERTLF